MTKTHWITVAVIVPIVAYLAYDAWALTSARHASYVFIDNNSASAVEVELSGGGDDSCSLAPYASCVLEVEAEEACTIVVQANGQELQRSTFTVPQAEWGTDSLYVIGAPRAYILMTVGYGNYSSSAETLQTTEPFTLLSRRITTSEINDAFSEALNGSGTGTTVTHLCHYDPSTEQVGCPGG